MNRSSPDAWTRANRLVRWYPKDWRARYGDEFSELLATQIAEQPRSWVRTVDVAAGATMARLATLGLSGTTVDPADQPRRSLATLGCALAAFLTFALSIWSQLTIASRSAPPATTATHTAIIVMRIAVTICLATAAAGSVPIAWAAIQAVARRAQPTPRIPALLFLAGTAVVIIGGLAFHNGWSGTASHPWSPQSTGPGGLAGFMWASTLTVSAYWAHPTILVNLPPSEIAWMVINPIALILCVAGAAQTVWRLELSTRLLRYVTHTARIALAGLGLFLFGTLTWLLAGGPGPDHQFQPGTVDQVGLVVMTATLIVAIRSTQRTNRPASITPPSPAGR